MLSMTDKPAPTPLLAPLVLPPNFRDVTAERAGTMFGIVGAEHLRPPQPHDSAPAPTDSAAESITGATAAAKATKPG
jgi:hypothetical protein